MKQGLYCIASNRPLTDSVYAMRLLGDTSAMERPGQFLNIRLNGLFLRRPLSVCDWNATGATVLYKVVGEGTARLSRLGPGFQLDVLTGLGNGYNTGKSGAHPLLIGGGVGVPPLYGLCRRLLEEGKQPTVILGFNTAREIFYEGLFRSLGAETIVTTADGSAGIHGFVTDAMEGLRYSYLYTCGPEPMLRAVWERSETSGQFSFEARMGCGFGACMGCSCKTKYGTKRICKDGPVLEKEEIIW